jgi:hypothetical protein
MTDKWQTRPIVREGAPYRQDYNFQSKCISGHEPHTGLDIKTDRLTVSRKVTLTPYKRRALSELHSVSAQKNLLGNMYNNLINLLQCLQTTKACDRQ